MNKSSDTYIDLFLKAFLIGALIFNLWVLLKKYFLGPFSPYVH